MLGCEDTHSSASLLARRLGPQPHSSLRKTNGSRAGPPPSGETNVAQRRGACSWWHLLDAEDNLLPQPPPACRMPSPPMASTLTGVSLGSPLVNEVPIPREALGC